MHEIVQSMAKRIVEKFHPQKVIVFGSWARGEAGPGSDVDLLIVLDCSREQKRAMQVAIRKELREFKVPKDIIVANLEDISKYKDAWWTVYHPALKEGLVLYEH
ncbi:Nucleotidyltransferase domain protein [Neomoorella glycerini]|uniref:Nucleotidyltransferase domain protein n=1 Tax=Neomoorella glycerini TaxID=55779 RepID=A0A6I5ZP72_9FIRM|nr:nucleotidyltransferase domain-containing protein [Moorella glycerini]QGP91405.1 Nucleotidyltransferase domain protein [Moorella glycerini]